MANPTRTGCLRHRPVVAEPIDHELFLSKFGEKDRKGIARHMMVWEEQLGLDMIRRWSRFAHLLMAMAPYPARVVSQYAILFYIPDGKYRMQVFGLQPHHDGSLALYIGNVLTEAIRLGILAGVGDADARLYRVANTRESLEIDELDRKTIDPDPVCKGMTGWHRKAIRIWLPAHAAVAQIEAAESLCALAAMEWAAAA